MADRMTRQKKSTKPRLRPGKPTEKFPDAVGNAGNHRPDSRAGQESEGNPTGWRRWIFSPPWWVQLVFLVLAGVAAYGHTLDVPYYLDDYQSIVENRHIEDWQDIPAIRERFPLRVVGYFTFAVNRAIHGLDVAGYHVVNLLIHLLSGCVLFGFSRLLSRTPSLRNRAGSVVSTWFPLAAALIFLLHPLQIQAVTYIVQRLASLAALLYLSSLALYLRGRLTEPVSIRWVYFAGSAVAAAAAFFTKQNTVTLPLAILLVEVVCFQTDRKKIWAALGGVVAAGVVGWFLLASAMKMNPFSLQAMEQLSRETEQITRIEYLATQTVVIWKYIGYFLVPVGLHLDHFEPVMPGFLDGRVMLSLLGHGLILAAATRWRKSLPVISFGILLYYLAHMVESGLIPIRDVLFEHRTYLPNAGLCLVSGWALTALLPMWINLRAAACAGIAITVLLFGLTWHRNQLWRSPIELCRDNVAKAPENVRAWSMLGQYLMEAGQNREAWEAVQRAMALSSDTDWPSAINHIILLRRQGKWEEALSAAEQYLHKKPEKRVRAKILANQGNILIERKDLEGAGRVYRQALDLQPGNLSIMLNLAIVRFEQGKYEESAVLFREVRRLNPADQIAAGYLTKTPLGGNTVSMEGIPSVRGRMPQPATKAE